MLELTKDNLQNAINKAKATKPRVRILEFRRYAVTNGDGKTYTVTFSKINGKKFAECGCISNRICYHIAAASGIHLVLAANAATA